MLQSKDCHALWVSQHALEASLPFPEDVDGGVIVRDASGQPMGFSTLACPEGHVDGGLIVRDASGQPKSTHRLPVVGIPRYVFFSKNVTTAKAFGRMIF